VSGHENALKIAASRGVQFVGKNQTK